MFAAPQFSVLMASYQRAHLIERAVRSLVQQTHREWELLVADDGSTDGTCSLLARLAKSEPRIRFWRHPNRGQARARNGLIEHARAPWITFLDSDDALAPNHLALRAQRIQQQPELEMLLAPMQVIGEPWVRCRHRSMEHVHVDECLAVGMLCVRTDRLRAAGGFPDTAYGEDAELITRLQHQCEQHAWLDARTYLYHRDHEESLTAQRSA